MAQTIKLKRSATQGATPTTSQLALGEVAINTYDGKMYIKKDVGGTESIVEIGADSGGLTSSFTLYEYTATASQTTFSGSDSNSNTLAYDTGTPPKILVYLNGVLLDYTTDYTATNGTSVVLTTGAAAGDLVQVGAYNSEASSDVDIGLDDNVKLKFGDDDDLEIYHDGTNSVINQTGTGDLLVQKDETTVAEFTVDGIVVTGDVEADEFIGDLRGAILFKAQAGEALAKGDVVYISGISGNTTIVSKADADDASKMPAFGLAAAASTSGTTVEILTSGILSEVDTSAYSEGDELFVSTTAGALTATAPTGESAALQKIGKVTRSNNLSGSIFITGAGRSNAVPNLNEGRLFVGNSSNQAVADDTVHVDIANSRVGIGTTNPERQLSLYSNNTETTPRLLIEQDGTGDAVMAFSLTGGQGWSMGIDNSLSDSFMIHNSAGGVDSSSQFVINPAGNVGIGTTNPSQKLHVDGNIRVGDANDVVYTNRLTALSNASLDIASNTGQNITFKTGSSERVRIDADGRLLINTTSSIDNLSQLHIVGYTSGRAGITLQDGDSTTQKTFLTQASGTTRFNTQNGTSYGSFVVGGWNGTTSVDFVTVNASGNVGIGTTSPSEKLEVNGRLKVQAGDAATSAYSIISNGGDLVLKAGADDVVLRTGGSGSEGIYFQDGAQDTKMFINAENGNVGIGTNSPQRPLHIHNSGTSQDVRIQLSDGTTTANIDKGFNIIKNSAQNAYLWNYQDASMFFGTNNLERLKITNTGNFEFNNGNFTEVGTISSGAITSSGLLTINQNQQGFRHIAPDVMSGHTSRNEMTSSWTADETRWYMFPTVDGSGNFNRELSFDYSSEEWSIEGPVTLTSLSTGNITTTGYLRGPSTFTIDPAAHGDDTGTVVIAGNLQVDGTTTTINSTTLTVDDKNITLASGSTNAAAANGAGLTVDCGSGTDATLTYDGTNDEWDFNKNVKVAGSVGVTNIVTDKVVKFNGTILDDSSITDTGSLITLGTSTDVSGPLQFTSNVSFSSSEPGRIYKASNHGLAFHGVTGTENDFALFTPAGQLMVVNPTGTNNVSLIPTAAGKVGIGTTSPVKNLHVNYSSNDTSVNTGNGVSGGAAGAGLLIQNTDSTANTYANLDFRSNNADGRIAYKYTGTTNVGDFHFITDNVGSPETKLFIKNSGYVGINNTDPTTYGTLRVTQKTANNVGGIAVETGTVSARLYVDGSGVRHLTAGTTDVINWTTSGNVGIGTSSPNAKLQIEEAGIETTTTSTSATTQVAIDTFAAATFRSARYTIQVTNSTDSTYHITEILLIHDGTTPQITEYGTIFTGSAEATFDADISSSNVRLLATPATTDSMTFKVVRHCITV